jgi:hypothetical protein
MFLSKLLGLPVPAPASLSVGVQEVQTGRSTVGAFVAAWLLAGYVSSCFVLMGWDLLSRRQTMAPTAMA